MTVRVALPIHPFPARMAPEIALAECMALQPGAVVLDPMAGSGTVLRAASEFGHQALGFDLDPLSVLMARVWTTPVDTVALRKAATELVESCREQDPQDVSLPWIDEDSETRLFVDYWFAPPQQADLRRLAATLQAVTGPIGDALRLGLSRIIVTKDKGASLARDVSHSRPHRVRTTNDFPVLKEFRRSVERLAQRLEQQPPRGNVRVSIGDARRLPGIPSGSVDAIITSPPYLNAIDYLRGHRLALVWLGYRVGDLRAVRANSIGAERRPDADADGELATELLARMGSLTGLPPAQRRMVERYVLDLSALTLESHRVLRSGGRAVFVIGNSCLRGVFIRNARALAAAAERVGFKLIKEVERELPRNRRYLPPPEASQPSLLAKRMRTETVMIFSRL